MLLNKYKISELRNSGILFSLKIPIEEKLAMTSQFNLTQFYDVIIRNSVFKLGFPTREFQMPFFAYLKVKQKRR